MNLFTQQRFQEIQEKGYEIELNQLWERGFHLWKRMVLPTLCAILLFSIPGAIIVILGIQFLYGMSLFDMIEMAQRNPEAFSFKMAEMAQSGEYLVRATVFSLVLSAIHAPLTPGLIKMCQEIDLYDKINFGTIFKYFAPRYYWKILVATIIITLCTSISGNVLQSIGVLGSMVNLVWVIAFSIFTALVIPLIIFSEAGPLEAFRLSFILISKNVGMVFVFGLLGFIFAFCGFILCCIGVIFSISYIYITYYLLYKQVIGFEQPESPDDLLASPESVY